MAFFESPRFPDGIALGATLGPEFSTEVVAAAGGREQRDTPLKYPKITGDISPGVKTQAQFKALRAFFYVARGRLHGWRIRDMADYTFAHSGTEIGIVILITGTTYQLHKRYVSGAQTFDRKITKPVTGTLEVRVSGSVVGHTVDTTTGVITIASAPAAGTVTVSGEFDVPARFDTDKLDAPPIARHPDGFVHQWAGVPIVEIQT